MDINELTTLRDQIESMEHIHQLRVLEIIKNYNTEYTENSNGIFINMTMLKNGIIEEIQNYIKYVSLQQQQLDKIEHDKETIIKEFYKDNKAKASYRS